MEQQIQQIDSTRQFAQDYYVASSARYSYNLLRQMMNPDLLAANDNREPSREIQKLSKEEDEALAQYTMLYSAQHNPVGYGEQVIELLDTEIKQRYGGLEEFLASTDVKNIEGTLDEVISGVIGNVYSIQDGKKLSSEDAAINYVTNGRSVGSTLSKLEELVSSQEGMDEEKVRQTMQNFYIVAAADMYVKAKRAEDIFGVRLIGDDNTLQLKGYNPLQIPSSDNSQDNPYDKAA